MNVNQTKDSCRLPSVVQARSITHIDGMVHFTARSNGWMTQPLHLLRDLDKGQSLETQRKHAHRPKETGTDIEGTPYAGSNAPQKRHTVKTPESWRPCSKKKSHWTQDNYNPN